MSKAMRRATKYFNNSVAKGQKKVKSILNKGGFDGISYANTFAIDTDTGFASAPSAITTEVEAGKAKLLGRSATDFPTVDLATSTTMLQNGNLIGIAIDSNLHDATTAANANSDKIVKKTILAYKKIEELHNNASWGTDPVLLAGGLLGFFNHPHIVKSEFVEIDGSTKWEDKTAVQVAKDITDLIRDYYAMRPEVREAGVTVQFHLSSSLLDMLTVKMIDTKTSVLQHLEEVLPKNRFKVEFVVTNALLYNNKEYVAIGDFRESSMSYNIPLLTEGIDTVVASILIRKDFIAESRGLIIEKANTAIICGGAA